MKNKRSTRALRGLTGLTSSLLVVALAPTWFGFTGAERDAQSFRSGDVPVE